MNDELSAGGDELPAASEQFVLDDRIVRRFIGATAIWLFVAAILGLAAIVSMLLPDRSDTRGYFQFTNFRSLHSHSAIYAAVANLLFAGILYSLQRLCLAAMRWRWLTELHFWSHQAVVGTGLFLMLAGGDRSRLWNEFSFAVEVAFVVSFLVFTVNVLATTLRRRQRYLYISAWYYLATAVIVPLVLATGLVAWPLESAAELGDVTRLAGIRDGFLQNFYVHGLLYYLVIFPCIGLLYYFVPHACGGPVRSYRLAVVQFWSLVLLGAVTAGRQTHLTAVPQWTSGLATVAGLLAFLSLWATIINLWPAAWRGAEMRRGGATMAFRGALIWWMWWTLDYSVSGVNLVAAVLDYTAWSSATRHALTAGFALTLLAGMVQYIAPRIYGSAAEEKLRGRRATLAVVVGALILIVPHYAIGATEAWMWRDLDANAQLRYTFLQTVQTVRWLWIVMAIGGGIYLVGVLWMTVDIGRLWAAGRRSRQTQKLSAGRLDPAFVEPPVALSQLDIVLDLAKKIDIWARLEWHRTWERKPLRIAAGSAGVFLFGSALLILPVMWLPNVESTAATDPGYRPLELLGRHLYQSHGCYRCHTQMVRPLVAEVKRYGTYTRANETMADTPALWGNRRIGPDLWREGGDQSNLWHFEHLIDPRGKSPGSVMPSFSHLQSTPIDFSLVPQLIEAQRAAGVQHPYADDAAAIDDARRQAMEVAAVLVQQGGPVRTQDLQITALIAYLQRLGVLNQN